MRRSPYLAIPTVLIFLTFFSTLSFSESAVLKPSKSIAEKGEMKVVITRLSRGGKPSFLVSSGIPFPPGILTSEKNISILDAERNEIPVATKILALWPQDRSIRSVLVQFSYPFTESYSSVFFKWGEERKSADVSIKEPVWHYPDGMILMPAQWLCDSEVIGEQVPFGTSYNAKYEENIEKYFLKVTAQEKTGELGKDGYYSTPHVFYQLYVRTGKLKYFLAARREFLAYRDKEIIQDGFKKGQARSGDKTRYVYVEAMADDYFLTGDPQTLKVAGYMADYMRKKFEPKKAFVKKGSNHFWTEREAAFPFLGVLMYYEMTLEDEWLQIASEYMTNLFATQNQWPDRGGFIHNLQSHAPEEGARSDEFGGSPFMTGLLLEPIIEYHKITRSEYAARSIIMALDWLMKEGLSKQGDRFIYMTADKYRGSDGESDINLLLAHAFGYGYRLSGYKNKGYLDIGQKIFNRGVKEAYLKNQKHFNQNYRSSGHFLAYIKDGLPKIETGPSAQYPPVHVSPSGDYMYQENFEHSAGGFKSGSDTQIGLQEGKLMVKANAVVSNLAVGINFSKWDIERYPHLRFSYFVPDNVPVGLRVKTQFGDWVCLGGTPQFKCEGSPSKMLFALINDGQWHEADMDVRSAVQSLLPALRQVSELQFSTDQNAQLGDNFLLDDFTVVK